MSYLSVYLDAGLTLAEKFSISGSIFIRGMGTVFMVLIILWGCMSLFKFFGTSEKPAKDKKPEEPAEAPVEAPAAEEVPAETTDDGALIAVITAAVEAYRASEGKSGLPYRVVSFKRKSGHKSWSDDAE